MFKVEGELHHRVHHITHVTFLQPQPHGKPKSHVLHEIAKKKILSENKSGVTGLIFLFFSAVFETVSPCGQSWTRTSDLPASASQALAV